MLRTISSRRLLEESKRIFIIQTRLHRSAQIESVVALPDYGDQRQSYIHDGQVVMRFPAPSLRSGASRRRVFAQFSGWLERQEADVYHQHSLLPPMSDLQVAAAKKSQLKNSGHCSRSMGLLFAKHPYGVWKKRVRRYAR